MARCTFDHAARYEDTIVYDEFKKYEDTLGSHQHQKFKTDLYLYAFDNKSLLFLQYHVDQVHKHTFKTDIIDGTISFYVSFLIL